MTRTSSPLQRVSDSSDRSVPPGPARAARRPGLRRSPWSRYSNRGTRAARCGGPQRRTRAAGPAGLGEAVFSSEFTAATPSAAGPPERGPYRTTCEAHLNPAARAYLAAAGRGPSHRPCSGTAALHSRPLAGPSQKGGSASLRGDPLGAAREAGAVGMSGRNAGAAAPPRQTPRTSVVSRPYQGKRGADSEKEAPGRRDAERARPATWRPNSGPGAEGRGVRHQRALQERIWPRPGCVCGGSRAYGGAATAARRRIRSVHATGVGRWA